MNIVPFVETCQVIDYSGCPSGELAVASMSLGCSYSCLVLNEEHREFLRTSIDAELPYFMSKEGPLYEGGATAKQLTRLFPEKVAPPDDGDSSDGSSGSGD